MKQKKHTLIYYFAINIRGRKYGLKKKIKRNAKNLIKKHI